jgi:DNA polymerase
MSPMDADAAIRARRRLALRAELAFGARAVPRSASMCRTQTEATSDDTSTKLEILADVPKRSLTATKTQPASSDSIFATVASSEAFDAPALSSGDKIQRLNELDRNEVTGCTRCRLCQQRTQTVFGEGNPDAAIMFIGEGPGENEDRQGRPFVGRAGEKLNKMIGAMGLRREDVYIANIVKCRPPGNREPAPDEVATCTPYLQRQIEIIRPRVIVTLGRPAAQHMLGSKISISKIRGQWMQWRGIKLMPTFHPAYILRNYTPETRAAVWSDLKKVLAELGFAIPSSKKS